MASGFKGFPRRGLFGCIRRFFVIKPVVDDVVPFLLKRLIEFSGHPGAAEASGFLVHSSADRELGGKHRPRRMLAVEVGPDSGRFSRRMTERMCMTRMPACGRS